MLSATRRGFIVSVGEKSNGFGRRLSFLGAAAFLCFLGGFFDPLYLSFIFLIYPFDAGRGCFYLSSLRFLKIIVSSFDALGGLFAGCVCGALFDFLYAF